MCTWAIWTKPKKRKKLAVRYHCLWRPWFLAHTVWTILTVLWSILIFSSTSVSCFSSCSCCKGNPFSVICYFQFQERFPLKCYSYWKGFTFFWEIRQQQKMLRDQLQNQSHTMLILVIFFFVLYTYLSEFSKQNCHL